MSSTLLASVAMGLTCFSLVTLARAQDQSGVTPSKLALPSGPGSLEGIGENAEPNPTMGLVSYSIAFSLPPGYDSLPVSLGLAYSSAGGASVVGMGWSLGIPSIERMTSQGLPTYTTTDSFAADGAELVRVPGTQTYRTRSRVGAPMVRRGQDEANNASEPGAPGITAKRVRPPGGDT